LSSCHESTKLFCPARHDPEHFATLPTIFSRTFRLRKNEGSIIAESTIDRQSIIIVISHLFEYLFLPYYLNYRNFTGDRSRYDVFMDLDWIEIYYIQNLCVLRCCVRCCIYIRIRFIRSINDDVILRLQQYERFCIEIWEIIAHCCNLTSVECRCGRIVFIMSRISGKYNCTCFAFRIVKNASFWSFAEHLRLMINAASKVERNYRMLFCNWIILQSLSIFR
jgi:hypothetical protein